MSTKLICKVPELKPDVAGMAGYNLSVLSFSKWGLSIGLGILNLLDKRKDMYLYRDGSRSSSVFVIVWEWTGTYYFTFLRAAVSGPWFRKAAVRTIEHLVEWLEHGGSELDGVF